MQYLLAEHFAKWSQLLDIDGIPQQVRATARRALVDTIGVIAAGARHEATGRVRQAYFDNSGRARVSGGGCATSSVAATINGTAAHAYDFDDTSYTGIMHGSAIVVPAVLAASTETAATDGQILAAFVAGSEVAYVLAEINTHRHFLKGWWSTSTFGLIGATAAVANLLKLNVATTANALGLAAAAAGCGRSLSGTDGKSLMAGLTARNALDIALAAQAGVTGPLDAFEQECGFLALLGNGEPALEHAATIGIRWRLIDPGLLLKRYPVCSAAHAAIEGTATICADAGISLEHIDKIECHVPDLVRFSLVYDAPETPQEAQFSLPYAVACAVLNGSVRFEDLEPVAVREPSVRALMKRVRVTVDSELSTEEARNRFPESARVTIETHDGRRLSGFCGEAYGMPNRPLTDEDILAKFSVCVAHGSNGTDVAVQLAGTFLNQDAALDCGLANLIAAAWHGEETAAMRGGAGDTQPFGREVN